MLFPGRLQDAFQFFCGWAWEKSLEIPGEKVLVVDGAWQYGSPQGIPLELSTIVQSGRKRQLRLMINAQQPNRLNSAILNGASEAVCFRLQSEPALDLVKRTWGMDPVEISSLQPLQFVGRNLDSGGELRGRIKL